MRDSMEDPQTRASASPLRPIPFFEPRNPAAEHLMELAPERLEELLACGRRKYGALVLRLGDEAAWRWLERAGNPYRHEIDAIRRRLGEPGGVMLNMSYEWSCTAGVSSDPAGDGSRLRRALDWPLPGLGRAIVVARQHGPAGDFYNVTWPGYVGVLTAMAPGRFSACINQPPLRRVTGAMPLDWVVGRVRLWRQRALPPTHLLRYAFETCASYADAKRLLTEAPLCLPVFFCLSGVNAGEGCVIERLETRAVVHESPAAISNHWMGIELEGHNRGIDSPARCAQMETTVATDGDGLEWLVPPILNDQTRLAAVANAARGRLVVQGLESDGPATGVFSLEEPSGSSLGGTLRPTASASPLTIHTPTDA